MKTPLVSLLFLFLCAISSYGQNDEARRHCVRAEAALKMGLLIDAVKEYKAAIDINPYNGNYYYNIALVQEKIGTSDMFKEAINNLNNYLKLVPDCTDREQVINKIYTIEFQIEAQEKLINQAENLKGLWRSDWYFNETGVPFWLFDLDLIDNDLRLTVLENSGLYRPDFTYKTVSIPYNKDVISFVFTNDTKHEAENNDTEHSLVDIISSQNSSMSMLSPLMHGLISSTAEKAYQSTCTYIFKLKISTDSLYGTVRIIEKRIDATTNKVIQDQVQYISFNKNGQNYPPMTKEEKIEKKIKEKGKKKNLMTAVTIDYSIPKGITAGTDAQDLKAGYMTHGFGFGFSLIEYPLSGIDTMTIGKKKNSGIYFCGGDLIHYYQIEAPYGFNVLTTDIYDNAKTVERSYPGSTSAGDIEISCSFGLGGYFNLSNKCFCDFEIRPLGAGINMLFPPHDNMEMLVLINYQCYISLGLNFLNKYKNTNGIFVSYSTGSPFAYITDGKGYNSNIYAQEKPKIDISFLHFGYRRCF
ncbi:MAG: hypothetical protein M0P26_02135 [Bacteroidales bacterium]|nr:hypothetical protein [Bacteroidales bacterium]